MDPQKRETDLINMSIVKRTWAVFPEEEKLFCASTNLMRRTTGISKDAVTGFDKKPNLSAVMNLFARNRELVHFSLVCTMNGGYAPTKILLRTALENALCMRLFNEKPDLAKEWFANPKQFYSNWTPQKIRNTLFPKESSLRKAYNKFYWRLCDYTHPSFRGWAEQLGNGGIRWRPIFNPDYASECFGLIFFIIVHSFKQFTNKLAFQKWLPERLTKEINKLLLRDAQMVRRHFQIRRGA
jgi:hypothetical protein